MRVLLVQPPLTTALEVTPPLGLCTLAAVLARAGHEIALLDLDLESKAYDDPVAATTGLFERALADFQPELCGVTSMYSNSLLAEDLVRAAKRAAPGLPVVAGGPHFGAQPAAALRRIPELDYAVEGEGEDAFAQLLDELGGRAPAGSAQRVWRRGEGIVAPARRELLDLDDIPNVWRTIGEVVDVGRYAATAATAGGDRRTIYIEAGRGCPFRCSFCATAPFWQRRYRVRPASAVIDEVRYLYEQFGYDSFLLVHDLLTVDRRYVAELCDAFLEARLPVQWMANHRADLDLAGLAPKMRSAGCWKLFFGMESGSQRVQNAIDKRLDVSDVENTIGALEGLGITSTCSFVVGFPDETAEELAQTLRLAVRMRLLGAETIQIHRLRLWPPAALAAAGIDADFDLGALALEYPFADLPPDHVERARADPEFFVGYRAPRSTAASADQLAQVEIVFSRAVALMPFTVAVFFELAGDAALGSFLDHNGAGHRLARSDFDVATLGVLHDFTVVHGYLQRWFAETGVLSDEQRSLLGAVAEYERRRTAFLFDGGASDGAVAHSASAVLYDSEIDVAALLGRLLLGGGELGLTHRPGGVLFVRPRTAGDARVFCVEPEIVSAVRDGRLPVESLVA